MEVESDTAVRADSYERPLRYVYDPSLKKQGHPFRYVFEEGALRCSVNAEQGDRTCLVSRDETSAIARQRPSFVYVDDGCWVDNRDGKGDPSSRARDFVLVCGPHVYLCTMARAGVPSSSSVGTVQDFITQMAARQCIVQVLAYLRARDVVPATVADPNLYVLLGDLHLPPASWFHNFVAVGGANLETQVMPPDWLMKLPAMQRRLARGDHSLVSLYRAAWLARKWRVPPRADADVFMTAGDDLVVFLDAIGNLQPDLKRRTHFIQTGDMFELWLGRAYEFVPQDGGRPRWEDAESPNRVAEWAVDVMIHNLPVIEAFQRLDRAGLGEVKYLWGNHDGYLSDGVLTAQLGLPKRDPLYTGLSGDLYAEHGHRFDGSNFDNTSWKSGPLGAFAAYIFPPVRTLEKPARMLTGIGHPEERDAYLLGATLVYLEQRYDQGKNPFSIYAMGHTHARKLIRYSIRTEFRLYDNAG